MNTATQFDFDKLANQQQRDARDGLVKWFEQCQSEQSRELTATGSTDILSPEDYQSIFRIFGYAGTGKTTITKAMLKELGVKYRGMAFTGKAALVMTRNGINASTIHSAIYRFVEPNRDKFKKLCEEYDAKVSAGAKKTDSEMVELKNRIEEAGSPRYELNEDGLDNVDLIVLDECSMVGEDLARDIESFGIPMLVLGDPGQLPPIEGTGALVTATPDAMLTEIHRQAAGNPIIQMSVTARKGHPIMFGEHKPAPELEGEILPSYCIQHNQVSDKAINTADQILCGTHRTRVMLNNRYRATNGFHGLYPQVGERLICMKNNKDKGLLNGMQCVVEDIEAPGAITTRARIRTELQGPDDDPLTVNMLNAYFEEYKTPGLVKHLDFWDRRAGDEFDFAYAITVHKAQGSQWDSVLLYDDGFGFWDKPTYELRKKWVYTGVTRAAKQIVVARR